MTEKHIVLEDIDPVVFYGVGNSHLQMIKALYPKLRIVARDNVIRVLGDDEQLRIFGEQIEIMRKHVLQFNRISEEDILDIVNGKKTKDESVKGVVAYTISGRAIKSRSENQQKLIDAFEKDDMVFAVGPAGTGKTYLAVAAAVAAFRAEKVNRIILTRPAVEAGERLGFLPGDLQSKVDPYLRPLYDALFDMLGADTYQKYLERGNIEVAPLAYMRGRTLDDSFIILDEAQNTSREQMKMFLTRIGFGSKVVITGDITQINLPEDKISGLKVAMRVLEGIDDIAICTLTGADVVRHRLVQKIIEAYEDYEKKNPADRERQNRTDAGRGDRSDRRSESLASAGAERNTRARNRTPGGRRNRHA